MSHLTEKRRRRI